MAAIPHVKPWDTSRAGADRALGQLRTQSGSANEVRDLIGTTYPVASPLVDRVWLSGHFERDRAGPDMEVSVRPVCPSAHRRHRRRPMSHGVLYSGGAGGAVQQKNDGALRRRQV
jgi:hypothetical protein